MNEEGQRGPSRAHPSPTQELCTSRGNNGGPNLRSPALSHIQQDSTNGDPECYECVSAIAITCQDKMALPAGANLTLSDSTASKDRAVSTNDEPQVHLRQEDTPSQLQTDKDLGTLPSEDKHRENTTTRHKASNASLEASSQRPAPASCLKGVKRREAPYKVTLPATLDRKNSRLYRKELALDRLQAADVRSTGLPSLSTNPCPVDEKEVPWWWEETALNDALWQLAMGEVGVIAKQQQQFKDTDLLPPPYGAAYVSHPELNPLAESASPVRAIFKVDSGCEPHTIVSRRLVERAGLKPFKSRTVLRLADCDTCVTSEEMVRMRLRVTIGDRPRIFTLVCVVWERGALHHDILISQTVAMTTGLSVFVHDNILREGILGRQALLVTEEGDPESLPQGDVATLESPEEDEALFQRISPIQGLRDALAPAPTQPTSDEWVNEELAGPLREVFGPLPKEPADVPPMEFTVTEELVKQRVYAKAKPTKLPTSSPRNFDVMSAQFRELKEAGIMGDSYPLYPPGPIASIAFTVPKPGVKRIPRPATYGSTHPLTQELIALHEQYTASLTAERLVCNFQPVNEVSVVQNYPLPSVQANLAKLKKFRLYAKIDLTKAFWSIPLHPNCIKWTYTIAPGGLSGVWLRAPMGLAPVPGYFMWTLAGVLEAEASFTLLYADDILVGANSESELRENIRKVLSRLLEKGFRVSAGKCQFKPASEIAYLGWIIRDGQIFPSKSTLDKIYAIKKPDEMITVKDDKAKIQAVRRFLGVLQYFGHFIPCHAEQLRPLYDLTKTAPETFMPKEKNVTMQKTERQPRAKFKWTQEADAAWEWGIHRLMDLHPLHSPSYAENTWLEVMSDASKWGWGGILLEWTEGDPRPRVVYCVSGSFQGSQLNWPTCTKEMYSTWTTVRKLRHFLHLHHFVLSTDHRNLLWSSLSANEMVQRMATDLQQYKFVMRHIDGSSNVLCDYLSRAEFVGDQELHRLQQRRARHPSEEEAAPLSARQTGPSRRDSMAAQQSIDNPSVMTVAQTEPEISSDHSNSSVITTRRFFGLSDSTISIQDRTSEDSTWSEEEESLAIEELMKIGQGGVAMPVEPANPNQALHAQLGQAIPPIQQVRLGEPRARQRRRHRIQRQPAPSPDRPALEEDDGLPIPHMMPQPAPPPRQLTAEQYHIIKSFHGGVLPHTGVAPLLRALREHGHVWDGIHDDVVAFVSRCHYCQLERLVRRGPQSLPYRSVQIPSTLGELWHFDVLGPLPACALTGARYVLVAIEDTSRLVMLSRAVECSVMEIMLFLLECFKVFGIPLTIKTDKASIYLSRALQELTDCTGIRHEVGIAHYHQSDGIVENGAAMVWPYLRIMCAELEKYHAWSPLLCNVQLGANALNRASLGGASASEIMFGRKIKPLRFLRPEAIEPMQGPAVVSTFMADQAAFQLRLLAQADAERHRRFRVNQDNAEAERDGCEDLDWVVQGMLVSIPQPENDQHFSRPYKLAFLRRGPYEVCAVRHRSVLLRDFCKAQAGGNPPQFLWPKYNLAPYYRMSDILPPAEQVIQVPQAEEVEPLPVVQPQIMPAAIISAHPAEHPVMPREPQHVRNFHYLVRWQGRPHASNSIVPYDAVWASVAFDEFIRGSGLTGHIPPQQFQAAHMAQIGALLRGSHNPGQIPMADPQGQARALRHYFPMAAAPRPHPVAIARLEEQRPMRLSQDSGPPNLSPQPIVSQEPASHIVEEQASGAGPGQQQTLRRSTRERRMASFGDSFIT